MTMFVMLASGSSGSGVSLVGSGAYLMLTLPKRLLRFVYRSGGGGGKGGPALVCV